MKKKRLRKKDFFFNPQPLRLLALMCFPSFPMTTTSSTSQSTASEAFGRIILSPSPYDEKQFSTALNCGSSSLKN